jgi:Zn-dependent protease with chaperone function
MKISRAIGLIVFQILLFIVFHDGAVKLYEQFFVVRKVDIGWGIAANVAVWLFALISVAVTVLTQHFSRTREVAILLIGFVIFTAFYVQQITYRPYRTLLLVVSAFLALAVPFLISRSSAKNARF